MTLTVPENIPGARNFDAAAERPENRYGSTRDAKERRRLQEAVIVAYRDRVSSYVRRMIQWPEHRREAEQVGAIGLLVALERFDAERGVPFWFFAVRFVRDELRTWLGRGVFWRPGHRANGRRHYAEHSVPVSMDAVNDVGDSLHDVVHGAVDIEDLVSTAEGLKRLTDFLSTLTPEDAKLLVNGVGFGRGRANSPRARCHKELVERATAFVRGNDGEERTSVRRVRLAVDRVPVRGRSA